VSHLKKQLWLWKLTIHALLDLIRIRLERWRALLLQLLKFGISGILGVSISAILYYGLRGRLPLQVWNIWFITVGNVFDLGYYLLTTIIGGTVHFALSKVWVFVKQK
jgi:hypothetical protein